MPVARAVRLYTCIFAQLGNVEFFLNDNRVGLFFQVLNLLGFICITVSSESHSRGGWFNTVSMIGFWFTGILLVFYLFHIIEKFSRIPWLKIVSCPLLIRKKASSRKIFFARRDMRLKINVNRNK